MSKINKKYLNLIKKSQISIFIIIGIIMIIISLFLFYNNKVDFFVSHDTKLKNQISDVVKNCIESNAKEAVFLLGFQGGYLNLSNPMFKIPGNYVDFGFKIPTWDSRNGRIPTIKSMELELNNYIKPRANSCIRNNLNSMKEYFDIKINSNLEINSTINPENVIISATLPIKFNEKNSEKILSIDDYYVQLDHVRLGSLYKLAASIYNLEARTNFLENLVLDQIYSASDYSHPSLSMPSEGMVFSCAPSYWTIPQLKRTLAKLNNNNFRYLQFEGTKSKENLLNNVFNKKNGNEDYKNYYEKFYKFKLDNNPEFENFGVDVFMPSSEITGKKGYFLSEPFNEFKVTPSNGMIVKPQKLKVSTGGFGKIPIPCIQVYHSLYSLDYNLIFSLRDYNEDGGNYIFQFPMRIIIKNNNPKKLSNFPILGPTPRATNARFCSNESRKYEIPVFITDDLTSETLSGVNISYSCIGLTCDLGKTEVPKSIYGSSNTLNSKLIAKFPFCSGGSIIASKNGYATRSYRPEKDPYQLGNNSIAYYEFSLIPTKKFNLNINSFYSYIIETKKGHRIYKDSNETIYVSVSNKKNDFESFGIYPSESEFQKIEFLKGEHRYNISIVYVDKDNNLKGLYEKNNVLLNPDLGNQIRIVFPSSSNSIDDKNFMNFYNYMESILDSDSFGISFK